MTDDLYQAIFHAASVLEIPVILAALLALAFVIVEFGRFIAELAARRRRPSGAAAVAALHDAAIRARAAGDDAKASDALHAVAWNSAMDATYSAFVTHVRQTDPDNRLAKDLADFDFDQQRRLGRTRLLVRAGPALGLMGTLIPLSPALEGLAKGDVATLTQNLRIAFSITVLGIFIGAIAFALSLVRDRLYGQNYSDLEYVASVLGADEPA